MANIVIRFQLGEASSVISLQQLCTSPIPSNHLTYILP